MQRVSRRYRDALLVLSFALGLRLLVAALTSGTYDYDEFVILLLSRDYAHGAVPYASFMFFHPPGALVVFRAIEPLTALWWPLARLFLIGVDTATALLVWYTGRRLYGPAGGLAAGLLYAASPLALVSAVRVGQDPLITALGMAGISLLVADHSHRAAVLAGACLALATWIKYPAILFVPVYLLLAPRRFVTCMLSAAVVGAGLMVPFLPTIHSLLSDTVTFQKTRWIMAPDQRVQTILLYWLLANVLAVVALFRTGAPGWLRLGFLMGGAFAFTSQVYYHYFVPIVPFAALLAAPMVARWPSGLKRGLLVAGVAAAGVWGELIAQGGLSPLYVTAARFADIRPAIQVLVRDTRPGDSVLADRFEYAYLAGRRSTAHYFWNVGPLVDASYLERRVRRASAAVLSTGASSGFPPGFTAYLDQRYRRVESTTTTIWLTRSAR